MHIITRGSSLLPVAMALALSASTTAIASPALGPAGTLFDVATASPTTAWAVGQDPSYHTMALRYDGQRWTPVTAWTPPTASLASFRGVSLDSTGSPWAAGWGRKNRYPAFSVQPIVARWNGKKFTKVQVPDLNVHPGGWFNAIDAISGDDVWAVGGYWEKVHKVLVGHTLIEHWDGTSFEVVPVEPQLGELDAVLALSADDVWASGVDSAGNTLAVHWDGSQWNREPTPNGGSGTNTLRSLAGTSSTDVWAVGGRGSGNSPLIEHWDGTDWQLADVPSGTVGELAGVSALAANKAWAVGRNDAQTIILHWNGRAWSQLKAAPGGTQAALNGVDADAPGDAWTVGQNDISHQPATTVLAHWDGTRWTEYDGTAADE